MDHFTVFLSSLGVPAGAGFGLTLAYLNLERFRYRIKLRRFAQRKFEAFDTAVPDSKKGMSCYQELHNLASLSNNEFDDDTDIEWSLQDKVSNKPIVYKNSRGQDRLPRGNWGKVYRLLFHNHFDVWSCCVLMGVCVLVLVHSLFFTQPAVGNLAAGVVEESWLWRLLTGYWSRLLIHTLVSLSVVAPLIYILCGREIVIWGRRGGQTCFNDVVAAMNADIGQTVETAQKHFGNPGNDGTPP